MKPKDPNKERLIFEATLRLVQRHGLAGITMATIGKEAGLGMGTMYGYFKGKEELINSLFRYAKLQNTERILSAARQDEPFLVTLKKVWISYVQNRIEYYPEHFFIDQCTNSHFLDADSIQTGAATYQAFYQILEAGKAQLLIKELDNEFLTAHLMGSANELALLVIQKKRKLDQEFINHGFALAWDSIKR